MKILIIWPYYHQYLATFRRRHPHYEAMGYDAYLNALLDDHFGWHGELARYMQRRGMDVRFVVGTDDVAQRKWAIENGFRDFDEKTWDTRIAMEQIRRFRPDVLWVSWEHLFGAFVIEALACAGKAITWIGSPFRSDYDTRGLSVLVTENPRTLWSRHREFERVIVTMPGFDPAVLKKIGGCPKRHEVAFFGQVSGLHHKRVAYLSYLLDHDVKLHARVMFTGSLLPERRKVLVDWLRGNGSVGFAGLVRHMLSSKQRNRRRLQLKNVAQDPVFGLELYRELARSRVTLNVHIDVAGRNAGNMRLFEATGVGTCLITEDSENIRELFVPGKEVFTYRTKREMLQHVRRTIQEPHLADRIGAAGQRRTLADHTIERMFDDIRPALDA